MLSYSVRNRLVFNCSTKVISTNLVRNISKIFSESEITLNKKVLVRNFTCKFSREVLNSTTTIKSKFVNSNKFSSSSFNKETLAHKRISEKMSLAVDKPKVVFVLGGPGAGKGTQCEKIVDNYGFIHLSAGDLLREERAREGSEYGELIEDCIKNGKIVPVEVTCSLLENAINKFVQEENKNRFLIDGFPRNQDNLDGWRRKMNNKVNELFVLFFDCDENICVERCLNRGKQGSGRSDDNMDSLKKRIQTYQNDSLPIIEYYKELNLVRRIDASLGPDKVFDTVKKVFESCPHLKDDEQK